MGAYNLAISYYEKALEIDESEGMIEKTIK